MTYKWRAVNQVFLDDNTGGKGKYFKTRFLQPGMVKYSFGVCVLEKETIDKFINDFVGCPVIIDHQDVTNENAKELSCGNICHIWYDQNDGWYWGDGIIDDEKAIDLINDGYNVSCQYEITEYKDNTGDDLHNGNKYDKVILNGKPEHLAIVKHPRYENAMIAVNAIVKNDVVDANGDKHGEDGKYEEKNIQKDNKEKGEFHNYISGILKNICGGISNIKKIDDYTYSFEIEEGVYKERATSNAIRKAFKIIDNKPIIKNNTQQLTVDLSFKKNNKKQNTKEDNINKEQDKQLKLFNGKAQNEITQFKEAIYDAMAEFIAERL